MKKFFGVIGNPPYQENVEGNGRANPIYNHFMEESYKVGERVELITPARFLFNAGQTPKAWNKKMLDDTHLKVEYYNPNGEEVFANAEIKGGVVVTYRDETSDFGAIDVFIPYEELGNILEKVAATESDSVSSVVTGAVPYRFTEEVRIEHPDLVDTIGASFDLRTNILDKLDEQLFFKRKRDDGEDYVSIFGLADKKRAYRWVNKRYVSGPDNFEKYKVFLPKASGNGDYGESLAECVIGQASVGHTQSFVSLGCFESEEEAKAMGQYIKTKFVRALLGVLKVTQDITPRVWTFVPLQDFTPQSDIDWSKPVPEIDRQLYAKYGLDEEEIEFIETHVKEMS